MEMHRDSEETTKKEVKLQTGIVNLEKRRYPRFNVDLPIEYCRIDSADSRTGRTINASEGGLLIYFPEEIEIGHYLRLKLLFPSSSGLDSIETLAQVVWRDMHLGEGWGDYRSGVRFIDISPEGMTKLKIFLKNLSER